MTEITLEDIENELNPDVQPTFIAKRVAAAKRDMLANMIKGLKKQEALLEGEKAGLGTTLIKDLILGRRTLNNEEFAAAIKKFGTTGIAKIEALEHLSKVQKQYIFKRMGYAVEDVE